MSGKAFLGAVVVIGISCSSAWAGATVPVHWQGVYLGVNGGVAITTPKWNETDGLGEFDPVAFSGAGGTVGVQAGYNWLFPGTSWLGGIETDINWAGVRADGNYCCGDGEAFSNTLNWYGTVRGRLGMTYDHALFFGTAGVAFGGWQHKATDDDGSEQLFSSNSTRAGYTFGGGVELALDDSWSMKAEFLYMNFGSQTVSGVPGGEAVGYHAQINDSAVVVRVGANKHF